MIRIPRTFSFERLGKSPHCFQYDGKRVCLPLQRVRCIDPGCPRVCSYAAPYCLEHTHTLLGLRVGQTNIRNPETGKRFPFNGLFATRRFSAGDDLAPYVGEWVPLRVLQERYPNQEFAPYAINAGRRSYLDAAGFRGVGSLANHSDHPGELNAKLLTPTGVFPLLAATKTIRPGQEILVAYGAEFTEPSTEHRAHQTVKWANAV